MRTILAFLVCGVVHLGSQPQAHGQPRDDLGEQVRSAAEARLSEFLSLIPPGQENRYGFHSREDFGEATIGYPYRVFTVDMPGTQTGRSAGVKPLNEWRTPIIVRGQSRALLTVAKMDDQWEAVDFGGARLALELAECEERNVHSPRALQRGILRLFDSSCDFLLLYDQQYPLDNAGVFPLESARKALHRRGLPVMESGSLQDFLPVIMRLSTNMDTQR